MIHRSSSIVGGADQTILAREARPGNARVGPFETLSDPMSVPRCGPSAIAAVRDHFEPFIIVEPNDRHALKLPFDLVAVFDRQAG